MVHLWGFSSMIAGIHGILEQSPAGRPVVWAYISAGMSVAGGVVTKTGADGWNASVASGDVLTSGQSAALVFRLHAKGATLAFMVGFNVTRQTDNFTDIDHALYVHSANLIVYENNFAAVTFPYTPVVGDYFKVVLAHNSVKYYYSNNGGSTWNMFANRAVTPNYPLVVDSSFNSNGAAINNVTLQIL